MDVCIRRYLIAILAIASQQAYAVPVIIGAPIDGVGNSNNNIFFNNNFTRYQQLYEASAFNGRAGYIDSIAFRPDETFGSAFSESIDLEVRLSTTTRRVGGPITTRFSNYYADNIGPDETLVLDEVVTLSSDGSGLFDITLDVADIFFYDGMNSLLLDIIRSGASRPTTTVFDAVSLPSPFAADTMRLSGSRELPYGYRDTIGFVTQIRFVSEPPIAALMALGYWVLIMRRRTENS